jgi:ribonuclease P protein component
LNLKILSLLLKCFKKCGGKGKMKKTKMLKKNYEFKKVLSKGKHLTGKNIEIVVLKNQKKGLFLGIAISTKIGKAVTRNRIKRLVRESYKNLENNIKEQNSIVILWRKSVDAKYATYQEIKQDMEKLFGKAKILIEKEECI